MDTALSDAAVDSLASLEERITRAVHLITELRSQNSALTHRVSALEDEVRAGEATQHELESANANLLGERNELAERSRMQSQELDEMRSERKEVRSRIEKLLSQLDLLSAS
jgi:chromosome segregation ATPase